MRLAALTILLLTFAAFTALAAEDGWYFVTTSEDGNTTYSIKEGSGERGENKKGEQMTVAVGKTSNDRTSQIEIYKWYVTDSDCAQEYGNLVVLDVDGEFKFEAPFAKGSQSIGSAIAETLCSVAAAAREKAKDKSI